MQREGRGGGNLRVLVVAGHEVFSEIVEAASQPGIEFTRAKSAVEFTTDVGSYDACIIDGRAEGSRSLILAYVSDARGLKPVERAAIDGETRSLDYRLALAGDSSLSRLPLIVLADDEAKQLVMAKPLTLLDRFAKLYDPTNGFDDLKPLLEGLRKGFNF